MPGKLLGLVWKTNQNSIPEAKIENHVMISVATQTPGNTEWVFLLK